MYIVDWAFQNGYTPTMGQFTSDMMEQINKTLMMKHTMSSPWHAEGNSIVERVNGTIKTTLTKLISEQPKEWDRFLNPLLFALRDCIHESHGYSPYELLFGRKCRGPMRILKELWMKDEADEEVKNVYEYIGDLRNRIKETCNLAAQEIEKSQAKSKTRYDKKTKERKLQVGDKVLLLLPTSNHKLMLKWKGPFSVVERVNPFDYKIEVKNGKYKTYHINMLKRYIERDTGQIEALGREREEVVTSAAVALVHDGDDENDDELLEVYRGQQKETFRDVNINPDLDEKSKRDIMKLVEEYQDIFSDVPGRTCLVKHEINLTSNEPVRSKPYPTLYSVQEEIDKEIDSMIKDGIIERSEAAYASPIVVVKKPDGSIRLCCNFKDLNKITRFDPEPMPTKDEIFNRLSGSNLYSKFDCSKGFYQISMAEESKDYTTFTCARGLFRFNVMPFGLVNSGASYSRLMRKVLYGANNLENYVDDILAHTSTTAKHMEVLRDLFERMRQAGLTLKPKKCFIGYEKMDFLGHTIGGNQIQPKEESIHKILEIPRPKNKKQVRSLIGAVNFYRGFIPRAAEMLKPFTDLTKNQMPQEVKWNEDLEIAFNNIKESLSKNPVLRLPDTKKIYVLQTDASGEGVAAVLMQEYDGVNHPIGYASRRLLDREKNFSVQEREALAIVWGVQKFCKFLYGREFIIETDHCGLQHIDNNKMNNARVMRWSMALSNYKFKIKYIKGENNVNADFLSRNI